ncbi:MAG: histidine kinase N-terminal 7TM domain-containing protein [Actinomycetota bacterium]|nr:histidine kinase N-terminal 7TM domain-containing protein [Actinomycetota bacterium]
MESFRVANLIFQSAYLVGHLVFIVRFLRKPQPTPVWHWFIILNVAFWLWVAGRFMETIVYLFLPTDNDAYAFAANFQYIGNTTAAISFAIWNLYLAGHDELASSRLFRTFMFAIPLAICILVFTNDGHQLFYTKLEMGQRVGHGPLFVPCFVLAALVVLMGYAVAVVHIMKTGYDKMRRLLVFSLYPAVPFIAALVRSVSGVDQFDYTPLGLAVSIGCLYLIVFRYGYAKIIPSSIETMLEQTTHPIFLYDPERDVFTYSNQTALRDYEVAAREFAPLLGAGDGRFEGFFDGRYLGVEVTTLSHGKGILVTATDLSDIASRQRQLDRKVVQLEQLSASLDEERRNIDAYLESLQQMQGAGSGVDLAIGVYDDINRTVDIIEANLIMAQEGPDGAARALRNNLRLTRECVARIRETVAQLKGGF